MIYDTLRFTFTAGPRLTAYYATNPGSFFFAVYRR